MATREKIKDIKIKQRRGYFEGRPYDKEDYEAMYDDPADGLMDLCC